MYLSSDPEIEFDLGGLAARNAGAHLRKGGTGPKDPNQEIGNDPSHVREKIANGPDQETERAPSLGNARIERGLARDPVTGKDQGHGIERGQKEVLPEVEVEVEIAMMARKIRNCLTQLQWIRSEYLLYLEYLIRSEYLLYSSSSHCHY